MLCVLFLLQLVGLPFAVWRTFRIEARFGFNRMTPRLFALDLLKQWLLGIAIGAPLVLATLALMDRAGTLVVAVGVARLARRESRARVGCAALHRTAVQPILARSIDAALRERVEALLARCGFKAAGGVFVMDGSRRSAHGNAYFTGIGRNKRIVFFDTLLERIDLEEIEAVLAHELGHFRLHHVRQRLAVSGLSMLAGLALLGWLARQPAFYAALGAATPSPAMALLLFLVVVPVFSYFATPLGAWWSRRHEREADDFAVRHASADRLAAALVKLYRDNAATLTPDPVHSAFYDSHPPALERIARLQQLASR